MKLPALALLFAGYLLGWYGYATIQQPVNGGCVGFADLLFPGKVGQVDKCISNNWGKTGGSSANAQDIQNAGNQLYNPNPTPAPTSPVPQGFLAPGTVLK